MRDARGYEYLTPEEREPNRDEPTCNRCGSTDVRWRHNGGKWTLFALQPGVLHVCELSDDDFGEVKP